MTSNQDLTNLLDTLKQLYSRVMSLHAESRTRTNLDQGNLANTQDLALPLSRCIDKITSHAVNKPADTTDSHLPVSENNFYERSSTNRVFSSTELGELSQHLKNSHRYLGVTQDTGDRLIQSTWEHFHTSIRLARQGNAEAARLHAELTNNALNEAIRYLPEAVYSQLSKDVMEALENINHQNWN